MRLTARRAGLMAGWLLTPVAAWAASFLAGWLAAVTGARRADGLGAIGWLGGGSLLGAISGAAGWVLLMRFAERRMRQPGPGDGRPKQEPLPPGP